MKFFACWFNKDFSRNAEIEKDCWSRARFWISCARGKFSQDVKTKKEKHNEWIQLNEHGKYPAILQMHIRSLVDVAWNKSRHIPRLRREAQITDQVRRRHHP